MRIGEFYEKKGLLTADKVQEVLRHSKKMGMRFDEAAIDLGYLNRNTLEKIFGPSFSVEFSTVSSHSFPEECASLLPKEVLLKWGVLPLGFESRSTRMRRQTFLRLGFLNPGNQKALEAVQEVLKDKGQDTSIKVVLILPEHFTEVMKNVFKASASELQELRSLTAA